MPDFDLVPLKQVIRPNGPHARSTFYRLAAEHEGLLRRLPGLRETYVHVPTLRRVHDAATAVQVAGMKAAA